MKRHSDLTIAACVFSAAFGLWLGEGDSLVTPAIAERVEPAAEAPETSIGRFDRIETSAFVLKDADGDERVVMRVDRENVVRLTVGGQESQSLVSLNVFPDGRAAMIFQDDRRANRLVIATDRSGQPWIALDDRMGEPIAVENWNQRPEN